MSEVKPMAALETLARYEPDTRYIGTGEYVAECVPTEGGDYYLVADVVATVESLLKAMEEREQRVVVELDRRTSDVIVVGGVALACSKEVAEAFELMRQRALKVEAELTEQVQITARIANENASNRQRAERAEARVAELEAENERLRKSRNEFYHAAEGRRLANSDLRRRNAELQARVAELQARVAGLEAYVRRWRKCKRMRKSWWLEAMAEAGRKGGRPLDEQIDEQPDAAIDAARQQENGDEH